MRVTNLVSGFFSWQWLRVRNQINYDKVVLVLVGENPLLDSYCLKHLEAFMKKRYVKEALVFYNSIAQKNMPALDIGSQIRFKKIDDSVLEKIYSLYCFWKFYDNIVFSYIDKPKDNHLGRYIRETTIDEEDAVCLALFHLRHIPACITQEK